MTDDHINDAFSYAVQQGAKEAQQKEHMLEREDAYWDGFKVGLITFGMATVTIISFAIFLLSF